MLTVINILAKRSALNRFNSKCPIKRHLRTFLSQAYYCEEVWEHRLNSPILQKVNLDDLYHELDQRFQKTRQMSAVDVDVFANAVLNNSYVDELLDLVHKLRLSADTGNTLNSTSHAVIRALTKFGDNNELLNALDDRLNYGLFLDFYTANLLLDTFWKNNDFTAGARIAHQLMLQEEFSHPISRNLALLHCYNYLLKPEAWPEHPKPEEPEEEIKIRVQYLRNPYDDDHFDLRDSNKIVGKTLAMFTKGKDDSLNKSLHILGLALYNKKSLFDKAIEDSINKNIVLDKEIIDLIPHESEYKLDNVKIESTDVQKLLKTNVEKAVQETHESDIAEQCEHFSAWEAERTNALEEQKNRLLTAQRIANIEDLKVALKEKETRLWFFDNEEQIELDIEAKKVYYPKIWFGKKKKPKKIDENYVPPEI